MINQPLMRSIEYYFNFVNLFLSFAVLIETELMTTLQIDGMSSMRWIRFRFINFYFAFFITINFVCFGFRVWNKVKRDYNNGMAWYRMRSKKKKKIQMDEKRRTSFGATTMLAAFIERAGEVNVYCFKSYEISWWLCVFLSVWRILRWWTK